MDLNHEPTKPQLVVLPIELYLPLKTIFFYSKKINNVNLVNNNIFTK